LKKHLAKIVLCTIAVALVIVLLNLPKHSEQQQAKAETTSIEAKIAKATELVEHGQNPMEGIMLFREILKEDPENIEVHYRLGLFSLQSGQMDKAVFRFEKVVGMNNPTYPDALFYLGQAYQAMGEKTKALDAYTKYKSITTDTVIVKGVDRIINELSNKN